VAGLALVLTAASAAAAPAVTVTLDPQRTTIRWTLSGFPDTVHGTFRLASGTLSFDPVSGSADGCLRVEARSGESGNGSRDRKMHEQVLETARFPRVLLRPLRVEGALPASGEAALRVQGLLGLHGGWHAVTLPVRLTRTGEDLVAEATLTIPYVAWGLTDPSVFVFRASKRVELELHAAGTLAPVAPVMAAPACEP
jgi:polyisoprenoid-binding protein YceI